MNHSLQEVLGFAQQLTSAEQTQLLSYLALQQRSQKISHIGDADLWIAAVLDALNNVLKGTGSLTPGVGVVKKLHGNTYKDVDAFITANFVGIKKTERAALYAVLARLLVVHAGQVAHKAQIPLSVKLTFNCCTNLPGLFDLAYPGYLEAGLGMLVIRHAISMQK